MKWLPVPSVPRCTRLLVRLEPRVLRHDAARSGAPASPSLRSPRAADLPRHPCRARRARRCAHAAPRARSPSGCLRGCPAGRCAISEVRAAIMPQPMSTPTAAGMTAPLVGITDPTVAPMPTCTSGIAATCLKMKGICAARASCARALSSTGTPRVHSLDRRSRLRLRAVRRSVWVIVVSFRSAEVLGRPAHSGHPRPRRCRRCSTNPALR